MMPHRCLQILQPPMQFNSCLPIIVTSLQVTNGFFIAPSSHLETTIPYFACRTGSIGISAPGCSENPASAREPPGFETLHDAAHGSIRRTVDSEEIESSLDCDPRKRMPQDADKDS